MNAGVGERSSRNTPLNMRDNVLSCVRLGYNNSVSELKGPPPTFNNPHFPAFTFASASFQQHVETGDGQPWVGLRRHCYRLDGFACMWDAVPIYSSNFAVRSNSEASSPFRWPVFTACVRDPLYTRICDRAGSFMLHRVLGDEVGTLFLSMPVLKLKSIYLPFGIAMFQAANSQFLHVASRQKQYAHLRSLSDQKPLAEEQAERLANSRWRRILRGVERADRIDRMMVFIAVGLGFQVIIPRWWLYIRLMVVAASYDSSVLRLQEVSPRLRTLELDCSRHSGRS